MEDVRLEGIGAEAMRVAEALGFSESDVASMIAAHNESVATVSPDPGKSSTVKTKTPKAGTADATPPELVTIDRHIVRTDGDAIGTVATRGGDAHAVGAVRAERLPLGGRRVYLLSMPRHNDERRLIGSINRMCWLSRLVPVGPLKPSAKRDTGRVDMPWTRGVSNAVTRALREC